MLCTHHALRNSIVGLIELAAKSLKSFILFVTRTDTTA